MTKTREIELGKRKLSSDEFFLICEGKNVAVTINPASLTSLDEKSTKRFPEYDIAQCREEIELCSKMVPFQVRGVILMTILSILQDRLSISTCLVLTLVEILNSGILPELPSLVEANDKQIMTDLVDSIDPATPKFLVDLTTVTKSPNNNETRRLLQLRAPTQASFILSAYSLQKTLPLIDISVALGLEVTGLSLEPFQITHHDQAHPHAEAVQTCNVIRNIVQASQYTGKYLDKLRDVADAESAQNALVVPPQFYEVPDLHGVLKHAVTDLFQVSRKEIISGDCPSMTDDVYPGIQVLSYIHFHAQHVTDVMISYLQSVYNRIQYVLMNATLFGIVLNDVDSESQDDLIAKVLNDTTIFTSNLHLVESLVSTTEIVAFLSQIAEKFSSAVMYEQALYLHILQIKTVGYIRQAQQQVQSKQVALLNKVAQLKADGKEQQAQKILDNAEKNKTKDTLPTTLPLGAGSIVYYTGVASHINQSLAECEPVPFSLILSVCSSLIAERAAGPCSFESVIANVINVTTAVEIKLPKGTRDISQEQMIVRDKAFEIITRVFKEHGAGAIDTPVFERREILTGKYGEDSKLIYDLADQGGEMLSLRYDLTVPFARFCATNGISNIKRFHIGKVYRRDQPIMTKGRFREFYQCDLDIAGEGATMCNDSEVISAIIRALKELPIGKFKLKLSHRLLLDAIMTVCGVPADKLRPICSAIDKLDKEPWSAVRDEMVNEKGLDPVIADALSKYCLLPAGKISTLLPALNEDAQLKGDKNAIQALAELALLDSYLEALGVNEFVSFDLSLARGLDYYTGVIYEAVLVQEGNEGISVGSIAAGGRYDKLVGMFSGKDIPAVGASIGLERILTIIEQRERENKARKMRTSYTQVLVASNSNGNKDKQYNLLVERIKLVGQLRSAGLCVEYIAHEDPNIRKQAVYAEDKGIPIIVWIGVDELTNDAVSVKIIKESAEDSEKLQSVKRAQLVEFLQQELAKL